uniref:Uncharacterized protein n=1 Tax=Aegilops tauschii subsp. strangulata TaxID=200361 RepID=A0A453QGT9_AEGTS
MTLMLTQVRPLIARCAGFQAESSKVMESATQCRSAAVCLFPTSFDAVLNKERCRVMCSDLLVQY